MPSNLLIASVIERLGSVIIPALTDDFAKATAQMAATCLSSVLNEYDGAAERRLTRLQESRLLLHDIAADIGDEELGKRLVDISRDEQAPLSVSALDQHNQRVNAVLKDVFGILPQMDPNTSIAIERSIWSFLRHWADEEFTSIQVGSARVDPLRQVRGAS